MILTTVADRSSRGIDATGHVRIRHNSAAPNRRDEIVFTDQAVPILQSLSPEHREIIELVYYHEKSVEDCARILGIPAATVKTRMFYARKKLAELVKDA